MYLDGNDKYKSNKLGKLGNYTVDTGEFPICRNLFSLAACHSSSLSRESVDNEHY